MLLCFYICSFFCLERSLPHLSGKFLLTFRMWLSYYLLLCNASSNPISSAELHCFLCHPNPATYHVILR